jgi:sugar/nucleoside kinase (ribokinase family)
MDLMVLGSLYLEVVFGDIGKLPGPGEETFTDAFAFSCGGALTPAVAARKAGATACIATLLGDDLGSKLGIEHCHREGVDLSFSQTVKGPVAGITTVLNFNRDRAFISHMPPVQAGVPKRSARWLDALQRARPSWCHVHPNPDIVDLLEMARAQGTRVALDVNLEEIGAFPDIVVRCARLADVFLPNAVELLRLTGTSAIEDAIDVAAGWCPWLVVKRGPKGAIAVDQRQATEVTEGLEDVVVRDRTGAGDAFAGAMIGRIARGSSLLEGVAAGNAAGSEAVARLGAAGVLSVGGLVEMEKEDQC